jgi:hypothetical protein
MKDAINVGPEFSYIFARNYFFFKDLQLGKDIFFTYGPLGFLAAPLPMGSNLLIGAVFYFLTYAILISSIVYLMMPVLKEKSVPAMALYTIFAWWVLSKCNYNLAYIYCLLLPVLILNYDTGGKPVFILLAASAVAFLLLIKTGWAIVGGLFLGPYLIIKLITGKKYALFFAAAGSGISIFLAAWFLVYHNLYGLPGFIFSSIEFVHGNDSAMVGTWPNDFSGPYFLGVLAAGAFLTLLLKERKINLIGLIFLAFIKRKKN